MLIDDKWVGIMGACVSAGKVVDGVVFFDLFREEVLRTVDFIGLPPFRLMSIYSMHLTND
jgi:hypothetical protein